MRFFVILFALAAVAFASDTMTGHASGVGYALPETDDVFDTYAYDAGTVFSTIGASFTDYAAIDDYENVEPGDAMIDAYTCWAVTTASVPSALEVLVVEDVSGVPVGAPISMNSYSCTTGDSGFAFGSYTIYLAEIAVAQDIVVLQGTTVWLGSHRNDGSSWYPLAGTTVSGTEGYRTLAAGWAWAPFSGSLEEGDLFKVVDGTVSLERNTWAGIKNMF